MSLNTSGLSWPLLMFFFFFLMFVCFWLLADEKSDKKTKNEQDNGKSKEIRNYEQTQRQT